MLGPTGDVQPQAKESKVQKPRQTGARTLKKVIFYGAVNQPKKRGMSNGAPAIIKDAPPCLGLGKVDGSDDALYKRFLGGMTCSDGVSWQSFLRKAAGLAMPTIVAFNEATLDLFASALLIYVHNSENKHSSLQLLERKDSRDGDHGPGWVTTPLSLYRRVRTGRNQIHLVLDPGFVYKHWTLLPAGVRHGLNGRDPYREAHRRQGGNDAMLVAFVPRPIGAEPSTVVNEAASDSIVDAGQNGSCACDVAVDVMSVVAGVSNTGVTLPPAPMGPSAASGSLGGG